MNTLLRAGVLAAMITLAACSSSGGDTSGNANRKPPVAVQTAMPVQRVFHTRVEAFGTLAADSRHAQTLTLPQAGQIVAASVTPGRRVRRGQTLLKLATDPSARNAYQQSVNALNQARDELTRTQRLHAEKLATNSQLDAARKALADAQAALDAQARLGGAQAVTTLTAPSDGVVTALDVALGERVAAGAKLVEFAPQLALAAQLGAEPEAAARIRPGMTVAIAPVYATSAQPLPGTVAVVADAVNPQTHLVDVLATIDGSDSAGLAAGAALSARIDVEQFSAWSVPRDALLSDEQGSYVFQTEQGKAHRVDVKVVSPDGDPVGVDGKLDPRAPVIALGAYELSDGDAVKAQRGERPAK
ncbi:MAG: efflux RND transporter periplasmic adaptor subunit [Rhodanobacteraceae bacterium]